MTDEIKPKIGDKKEPLPLKGGAKAETAGVPDGLEAKKGPMGKGFGAMPEAGPIQYKKMFYWGWQMVRFAPMLFFGAAVVSIVVDQLRLFSVKLLEALMSIIGGTKAAGAMGQILPDNKLTLAFIYLAVGIGMIGLPFLNRIITNLSDLRMCEKLQLKLHDKLLSLGPSYHENHDLGETSLIVNQYSSGTQMFISELYSLPFTRGISFVTAVIWIMDSLKSAPAIPSNLKWGMLVILLIFPVFGWWLAANLKSVFTKVRDCNIALSNEYINSASLPLEVQLMKAENQRSSIFKTKLKAYFKSRFTASLRNEIAQSFNNSVVTILRTMFIFSAVYYSIQSSGKGTGSVVSAIFGFMLFIPEIVSPIQELISFISGINRSWPQVESVIDLLESEPDVKESSEAKEIEPEQAQVELKNVVFSYTPGGTKVLDDLNYVFNANKVTAIVAESGGGKSTILNLLVRLRDPNSGQILIDNNEIRDFTLASLRKHVAKVSQFPLYITDTVRENFRLAKADATDREIEAACRKTGFWRVLEKHSVPGQHLFDLVLSRDGKAVLSGGEYRNLSITRSLLWKPKVLIVDEPTTGVDPFGRQAVAEVLKELSEEVTILLVDHDMEFVSHLANQVCCLKDGKFVDVGSPEELLKRDSLFKQLIDAASTESESRHKQGAHPDKKQDMMPKDFDEKK